MILLAISVVVGIATTSCAATSKLQPDQNTVSSPPRTSPSYAQGEILVRFTNEAADPHIESAQPNYLATLTP